MMVFTSIDYFLTFVFLPSFLPSCERNPLLALLWPLRAPLSARGVVDKVYVQQEVVREFESRRHIGHKGTKRMVMMCSYPRILQQYYHSVDVMGSKLCTYGV